MRALRRRAIGCAALAATGAVLLVAVGAQADVGPNQATFRDRVGDGIKTGQMGVQLFNYGGFINNGGGQTSNNNSTTPPTPMPSPVLIPDPLCAQGGAEATTPRCRTMRLGILFDFLRQRGVTNVELFGHAGFPASNDIAGLTAYRALLDTYGLHAGGWHGSMAEGTAWDERIAAAKILGADYIGSGGFPAPGINSYADTLATAEALNRLGKRSIEAGLGPVYWHNHQTEFTNQYVDEGVLKPALDIIMERTDGRYVVGEIDVKWSSDALNDASGVKTAEYINKPAFGTRVQMLHIKDGINIESTIPPGQSAPHVATGSGEIDFKPIFTAAANKVRYYHQEHDGGSLADGNVSLGNLKGIGTAVVGTMLALPPTFNSVPANTPAASNVTPVTVTNTGDVALTITNVTIGGVPNGPNDSADFQVVSQNCTAAGGGGPLAPGGGIPAARGTCTVNVGFRPTRTNYTSVARLNFTSGADTATENVLLVGKSTGDAIVNVGGNVPSVLQLSVPNTSGSFGTFVPGIGTNYNTALAATVTTTTGDAALSVTDPSATAPGHLVNGAFSLASPLNIRAVGLGDSPLPAFVPLSGTAGTPLSLRSWSGPTTATPLTLDLRQAVGATEALRAGTYSKALTFTLSTTTP
jgi:sugar phosphate isomerase/epimerase